MKANSQKQRFLALQLICISKVNFLLSEPKLGFDSRCVISRLFSRETEAVVPFFVLEVALLEWHWS